MQTKRWSRMVGFCSRLQGIILSGSSPTGTHRNQKLRELTISNLCRTLRMNLNANNIIHKTKQSNFSLPLFLQTNALKIDEGQIVIPTIPSAKPYFCRGQFFILSNKGNFVCKLHSKIAIRCGYNFIRQPANAQSQEPKIKKN